MYETKTGNRYPGRRETMIHFVGAGSGAVDLITVRGQKLLEKADVIVYAGSLVNPQLLENRKAGCEVHNSAYMTMEEVIEVMVSAEAEGKRVVRLHTGDPSIYGAVREQMDELKKRGIAYEVCPGVSSFCGAAAALKAEYTLPDVSQSVIITRMAGRTPVPEKETIRSFAAHQATMVVFLSTGLLEELQSELKAGGYPADTPAAIVYKATWPDEKVCRCTIDTLADTAKAEGITKTALIIVGYFLEGEYRRSQLYNPEFTTEFRMGEQRKDESGRKNMSQIYAVGIGPGNAGRVTEEAKQILSSCDVIIGYTVYVDLVRKEFQDGEFQKKEFITTPMKQEVERCRIAFERAESGKAVAMVCSGDAGVYGMAGLLLEMAKEHPNVKVEVIPGITAALGGAAVLGAPLVHDFAVVSLSDLLTPWEKIEKRLRLAAQADFSICLYNPSSKKRSDYLRKACEILLEDKAPDTVCGTVRNIGREGEDYALYTLEQLRDVRVDMFTTVFIGNSQTKNINGRMVTPRGYRNE